MIIKMQEPPLINWTTEKLAASEVRGSKCSTQRTVEETEEEVVHHRQIDVSNAVDLAIGKYLFNFKSVNNLKFNQLYLDITNLYLFKL